MSKKLIFVFNPQSGKGKIKSVLFDIVDMLTKADFEVTVYPTQCKGDCAEKISHINGYDYVMISGGDGTLNEAVCGMLRREPDSRIPIGYIPTGTMNDFASGNGIPKSAQDAVQNFINGTSVSYDIGSFNNELFIYVAAFGVFTDVSYDTPQSAKNIFGAAAYFWEGMKRLPKIQGVKVKITTDDGCVTEEEVLLCLIINSVSVAGFEFGDFYDVDTSDGIFEIVLIPKKANIINIAGVINDIKNGERNSNGVRVISTKSATIETASPVRWTLDGEYGGETNSVKFEVLHQAVQFVFNKKSD